MNSMKLVILLHSLSWSIHTKDECKCRIASAFIFGVNWLWRYSVTASFGVFFSWNKIETEWQVSWNSWKGIKQGCQLPPCFFCDLYSILCHQKGFSISSPNKGCLICDIFWLFESKGFLRWLQNEPFIISFINWILYHHISI